MSLDLEPVPTYSLKGDPNFSQDDLPKEMRRWHKRLWGGIEQLNEAEDDPFNPVVLASSGDLYALGRRLNVYLTSLLTAFRVTGDLELLDEVDRIMEIARGELKDYNADGFLNWRYLNDHADSSSRPFYGDDYHVMDDILTHSLVAAVAYALEENAEFSDRYAEHAAFWTDYLQNDFERKWRRRKDVPFDFPFISKDLTHAYAEWIRYHYYMAKLTGDGDYYREAERMARQMGDHPREVYTTKGPAFVWNHRFTPASDNAPLSCQPFIYLQYTFQSFQDLALEGFSVFGDDAFMQKAATSMTELVMDNGYTSFARDICGGFYQRGLFPSSGGRGEPADFANFPYGALGKWDATGKIEETVREVYGEVTSGEDEADFRNTGPAQANLSAIMLLLLAGGEQQASR